MRHAALCGDVDEQSAGDDLRKGLDTESRRSGLSQNVAGAMTVVGAVTDVQVVQPVDVGSHLGRRFESFGHPMHMVVPDTTGRRYFGYPLAKGATGKGRHVGMKNVGKFEHLAGLWQPHRPQPLVCRDFVERPGRIVCAPTRWEPRLH